VPEVKLFISTSIDGFIAAENGSLDQCSSNPRDLTRRRMEEGGNVTLNFALVEVGVVYFFLNLWWLNGAVSGWMDLVSQMLAPI
jgi:hypothetical protein